MTEETMPEENPKIDLEELRTRIDEITARAVLRKERIKRQIPTPEEKLLRAIFGEEKEEEIAEQVAKTVPDLVMEGVLHVEMQDDLTIAEFSELLTEFNNAYASIRFLLRKFSGNDSDLYQLLSFPPVQPLPTLAQPIFSKAQFNSPGFWEMVGNLNPFKVICDYVQQRHERKKDNNYRNRLEEQRLALENLKLRNELIDQQIKSMKEVGFSDEEIKELLSKYIGDPLEKLSRRVDSGQIKSIETKSIDKEEGDES